MVSIALGAGKPGPKSGVLGMSAPPRGLCRFGDTTKVASPLVLPAPLALPFSCRVRNLTRHVAVAHDPRFPGAWKEAAQTPLGRNQIWLNLKTISPESDSSQVPADPDVE